MDRKLNAIVLEDDPTLRGLIADELARDPAIRVRQAGSLGEAVAMARGEESPVYVVDLTLPDAAGVEAIVAIRRVTPGATIVGFTGGGVDAAAEARRAGATVVIEKGSPESYGDKLRETVRQAVCDGECELYAARARDHGVRADAILARLEVTAKKSKALTDSQAPR